MSRRCTPGQVWHVLDSLVEPRGLGTYSEYMERLQRLMKGVREGYVEVFYYSIIV